MKYTEHFSDNTDPKIMGGSNDAIIQNKMKLVLQQLERARVYFDVPFAITSGFRSLEYNKSIGGAFNSQHLLGEALDFQAKGNIYAVYEWIVEHLEYDQVIYESKNNVNWIHFSYKKEGNRKQALIGVLKNYKIEYMKYKK